MIALLITLAILKKFNFITSAILAILLGAALSLMTANNLNAKTNEVLNIKQGEFTFNVEDDQKLGSYYNSAEANMIIDGSATYKVKLQVDSDFEEIHAGDIIKANVKFSSAQETQINNYWQNGICANARATKAEKIPRNDAIGIIYEFRNSLITCIRSYDWAENDNNSEAEQLLNAIICGQRIDLSNSSLYDSFKCCGLAHLVAVSGAHLSLVTGILLVLLKRLKLKRWLIIFFQSLFILAYLICAAVPISALRAAFMAYIALFAFFGKRRAAPLNALGLCIIILISFNTETCVSISFALSALSTIGIILFSNLFEYWISKPIPKCPEFIKSALGLTFAASLCSQPLSVSIFTQLPIIAPVSNIICTPIFTLLCGGGLISSVFATSLGQIFPILSSIFMWISYAVSQVMCEIVKFLSTLPYASIPATINIFPALAITVIACFLIYVFWPKQIKENRTVNLINKTRYVYAGAGIIFLIVVTIIFIPKYESSELKALDVGQGDSILLKSKGKNFMIDTGNQDNLFKQRLAEEGINHLDGLIITHPDDDHCGSLDIIKQLVQVDNIYVARDLPSNAGDNCKKLMSELKQIVNDNKIIKLNVGDKISFGEIELDVIWPDKLKDDGGNCDSVCVIANIDISNDGEIEARALLCGDAEKDEIDEMISKRRIPKLDIYKCGHHGSGNALNENNVRIISPKITLISVGAKNKYGHPNSKTIKYLESVGSKIYRTDYNGTITCKFSSTSIDISTQK